jgi:hypothetical protein
VRAGYYITLCGIVSLCALVTIRRTSADDGFAWRNNVSAPENSFETGADILQGKVCQTK